ncbi:MAG: hypothetical protein L0271_21940 [Gemmatimonadetes bacterium]|nr:hypothetical protein [Gemmatimonadota bacterium]
MRPRAIPYTLALTALVMAGPAAAQLHITPTMGSYRPGESAIRVDGGGRLFRGRTLGMGLNLEAGFLRGTIAYATGATIRDEGLGASGDVGEGSLLAMTAGIALRPLPRLFGLQPYGLLGGGIKRFDYSWNDDRFEGALSDEREFVIQYGAGADLMLGGLGVVAEIYDMVAPELDDSRRHDTFVQLGLRFRLGGGR